MEGQLKPQHDFAIRPKETTMTLEQVGHLMEIDKQLDVLFPLMEADYKEMHRLPKKLSHY